MYHSISNSIDYTYMATPLNLFEKQMDYLHRNHYSIISAYDLVEIMMTRKSFPERAVVISFDDGFRDNLLTVQVLKKYKFPAIFFIAVEKMDKDPQFLSWHEVQYLSNHSLFSIGSHTFTHPLLKNLSNEKLICEISFSKQYIEDHIGKPVYFFAYPFGGYGSYDDRTVSLVRSSGYCGAFSTISGTNMLDQDRYQLRRTRISWFDDEDEFPKAMQGGYDWYHLWQRLESFAQ